MSVVMVISNHPDLADQARSFGVPFLHVPATKDIRARAEQRQLDALRGNVDLVVLARYMQIITAEFLAQVGCPLINIHHSFLPSFVGAAPYRRAKERGVKLIGATAHYVTEHLDDGPIIEQDVVRVDHRHHVADLTRLGADAERAVLSRAVRWHCEDRIIRHATPPTPTRVDATPAIGMGRRTGIGVPGYRSPMGPRTRNCQRCRQSFGQRRVSNVASGGTLRFGRRPFCWPVAA
jgi:formyltetrahydrofolate deformylase